MLTVRMKVLLAFLLRNRRLARTKGRIMKHIFGNLKKYWYLVLAIIVLLFAEAYCDLSLPDYTSNIIDVGITNSGIEHTTPQYLSETGYYTAMALMTAEEKADWTEAYTYKESEGYYELTDTEEETWDAYDEEFSDSIVIAYLISSGQTGTDSDAESSDSSSSYSAMFSEETMAGLMTGDEEAILEVRATILEQFSTLGDSMTSSMAKKFVIAEYEACGIDLDKIQTDYLWKAGGRMIAMAFVLALAAIAIGFIASIVAAGVGRDLRSKVFRKVIGFSNAEMDRFSTASLITRSTNDVQQIQQVTVFLLRMVLYAPILAIGGVINIRRYNSGMGWVIVLAIALIVCLIAVLMLVAMPKFKVMQEKVDKVNLIAREILTGLPVIRAFSREKREEERFDEANSDLTGVMLFVNRTMAIMMPVLTILMNGVSVLIVWVAAHKIDSGNLEVGSMTAFITYAMLIIMGFLMMTAVSIMLPRAAVAANRIQEVIDSESSIENKKEAATEKIEDATLVFSHVNFRYPESVENALEDIDFVAKPGQTTAIIGSTGCGKSTLVKLVPRFFDVSEGSITIGGRDLRDWSLESLRSSIGYVPQKGILFSGDITSNIAFGAPDATEEEIREAAAIAQATDFIEDKPKAYASEIAQGGTNVSGGQKQRLSIARAIARDPKLYIFDDSFSALDFKTDVALRKALAPKTKDAVVLIVAQRVSTILNADQIIVLEEGRMIGKGTHRELVETCETYRQIAESQMSEAEFAASIAGKEVE